MLNVWISDILADPIAKSTATLRTILSRSRPALIAALIFLAVLYFAWPVWRAQWPIEIDLNEAWNAFQVQRLRSGLPLYPEQGALISNNYPPLSFLLIDWLSFADPIMVGRALCILATLAIGAGIYRIVHFFNRSRTAAIVAAAWYIATMARYFDSYVGMNDPNLLALSLMTWGLVWTLYLDDKNLPVEPAFLLMVTAGFFKHNLMALPLAAFVWLLSQNWRSAVRAGAFGIVAAGLGLLVCVIAFGHAFVEQLTAPRVIDWFRPIRGAGRLQFVFPGLVLWAVWYGLNRRTQAARFSLILIVSGLFDHFSFQIGSGVDDNSEFELIIAVAVGIGFACQRSTIVLVILLARLLLSDRIEPYLVFGSKDFRQIARHSSLIAEREQARVKDIIGTVACSIASVCYRAGKPFVYDEFSVNQRIALGKLPPDSVRHIVAVAIDPRAGSSDLRNAGRLHLWTR